MMIKKVDNLKIHNLIYCYNINIYFMMLIFYDKNCKIYFHLFKMVGDKAYKKLRSEKSKIVKKSVYAPISPISNKPVF